MWIINVFYRNYLINILLFHVNPKKTSFLVVSLGFSGQPQNVGPNYFLQRCGGRRYNGKQFAFLLKVGILLLIGTATCHFGYSGHGAMYNRQQLACRCKFSAMYQLLL
jgi:hypothetical protein